MPITDLVPPADHFQDVLVATKTRAPGLPFRLRRAAALPWVGELLWRAKSARRRAA